jgi:hypothetical protein
VGTGINFKQLRGTALCIPLLETPLTVASQIKKCLKVPYSYSSLDDFLCDDSNRFILNIRTEILKAP